MDPFYWRVFNVLLRLLGLGATFAGGMVVMLFGLGYPPAPDTSQQLSWGALVTGGLLLSAGLGFLLLPPYRPDLGDSGPLVSYFRGSTGRRWWTGEPL